MILKTQAIQNLHKILLNSTNPASQNTDPHTNPNTHLQDSNAMQNAAAHFPTEGMDMLYLAENKHFWHIARREFIYNEVSRALFSIHKERVKEAKILDLGAGTGSVTRHFLKEGFSNIALGEIHPQGLEYAKTYGIHNLYCMDLLDVPFCDEFDCIFAFDVLEHIENDALALQNMRGMLRDRDTSLLALSVPAHKWLWNAHDVAVHHKRRYVKNELVSLVEQCGFEVVCARYFFVGITPLLWARALLHRAVYPDSKSRDFAKPKTESSEIESHRAESKDMQNRAQNMESKEPKTKDAKTKEQESKKLESAERDSKELDSKELRDTPPPQILNASLLGLCRLENKILNALPQNLSAPFGGSLLVIARNGYNIK